MNPKDHTIKTDSLEQVNNETYRMIAFVTADGLRSVVNIYESDLATLNFVLSSEHPEVEAVENQLWSDRVYPDCLTVFETAEAMMVCAQ